MMFQPFCRGGQQGFTLVELMVICAVIMILTALLLPRYLEVTDTAKLAKCHGNISTLNSAASMYLAGNGEVAASLQDLAPEFVPVIPSCPFGAPYDFDGYCIINLNAHDH
ncbi:prepilin-type N-terminal cleavage/methylation domain-containing protein [Candidatus Fermentibacteria bacterium]|nr:prepilin-type N-terminal cleavage/methylation domain-containing protein [Candidatus Fermentibacteria bacterium]